MLLDLNDIVLDAEGVRSSQARYKVASRDVLEITDLFGHVLTSRHEVICYLDIATVQVRELILVLAVGASYLLREARTQNQVKIIKLEQLIVRSELVQERLGVGRLARGQVLICSLSVARDREHIANELIDELVLVGYHTVCARHV